jgi:large subunit ribosomal protein L20
MPRVKRGNKRKEYRKKILKRASGYFLTKSKLYQAAEEAVERGLKFAYRGRKEKKRQFRALWIVRINAAAQLSGISYSQMMHGLKLSGIELDRKVLADLAVNDPQGFAAIAAQAKDAAGKQKSEADQANAAKNPKRAAKDGAAHDASKERKTKPAA